MRIISGSHKGRQITAPNNLPARPTTDMAKESLFNILYNHYDFDEIRVLDLFCGTGNISYEFASRGVPSITAIDQNFNCIRFVKATAEKLNFEAIATIKTDAFHFLKNSKQQFDVIFADPPFDLKETVLLPALVFENNLLKEGGRLIIEHPKATRFDFPDRFLEHRKYGKINFSIFG